MVKVPTKDKWITQDGKVLEIGKMTSSHLLATIHMIERKRLQQIVETVLNVGGVILKDDETFEYYASWPAQYEALIAEAQRRHLIFRGNPKALTKQK